MLNWLAHLFTPTKTVDDFFDKDNGLLHQAGEWIGNLHFTDEEKAEMQVKLSQDMAEFVKMTLSESTVRSRTRRFIAILWIMTELGLVVLSCLLSLINMDIALFCWTIATSNLMLWGTLSIIGFFFGGYIIGQNFTRNKKP